MNRTKIGFIHGRFQLLHNDHMEYLLAGSRECEHLLVGITNPDPAQTEHDSADLNRSQVRQNPLTFFERLEMLRGALCEYGLRLDSFTIVPFPINNPSVYHHYVPLNVPCYITIYDAWGERKKSLLENAGYSVRVLWNRPQAQKGITASHVRQLIRDGAEWAKLVPKFVYRYAVTNSLDARIRDIG